MAIKIYNLNASKILVLDLYSSIFFHTNVIHLYYNKCKIISSPNMKATERASQLMKQFPSLQLRIQQLTRTRYQMEEIHPFVHFEGYLNPVFKGAFEIIISENEIDVKQIEFDFTNWEYIPFDL